MSPMPRELTKEQKVAAWDGHSLTLQSANPDVVTVQCRCGFDEQAGSWRAGADLAQAHLDTVSVALFGRPGGPPSKD